MDSNHENAMIILKAMVERSRVNSSNGDVIRKITNLECDEINNAVPCLEEMNLVKTVRDISKVKFDFFNVTILPEGYEYYNKNFGKIKSID
jgi:hypothetical protein